MRGSAKKASLMRSWGGTVGSLRKKSGTRRIRRGPLQIVCSILAVALATATFALVTASAAFATCNVGASAGINYDVFAGGGPKASTQVARVGDTVRWSVTITETADQCGFTGGTVKLIEPDTTPVTFTSTLSLTPGQSQTFGPTAPFTVTQALLGGNGADPGTLLAIATLKAKFLGQPISISTQRETPVIQPETTITKTPTCTGCGDPTNPTVPADITYQIQESNVSNDPPAALALATGLGVPNADTITNVTVSDDDPNCLPSPPTFISGDTNNDQKLDPGETWLFECTTHYGTSPSSVGIHTDNVTAKGDAGDGREAGTPASQGAPSDENASATINVQPHFVTVDTQLSTAAGPVTQPVQAGTLVTDQATINNATTDAGGDVSYAVYTDNACTQGKVDLGDFPVVNGAVGSSNAWTAIAGNFWFQATYSGDANNVGAGNVKPILSTCTSEPIVVQTPCVNIVKFTNGADANDPNGPGVPEILPNGTVTWTYQVTNCGTTSVARNDVDVTDNTTGVTPTFDHEKMGNGDTIFDPGEVWIYIATGTALDLHLPPPPGVHTQANACTQGGVETPRTAYINLGTVMIPGASDSDPSSYCNPPVPGVNIEKDTNGFDANDPNGTDVPEIAPNGTVTWTYIVTNTGESHVPRAQVMVTDNTTGITPVFDHEKTGNGDTIFDPGEVWIYKATGTALDLHLPPPAGVHTQANACTQGGTETPRTAYINLGTVTIPGATDNDPSGYCNPPVPGVTIEKDTNGFDANDPNGTDVPEIAPAGAVTWTYIVTNTGETRVPRAQVMVTDNTTGVTPVFDHEKTGNGDTIFDPGEVWIYKATGTALDLHLPPPAGTHTQANACTQGGTETPRTAYINLGTVMIPGASDNDPSSYCNPPVPNVTIEKDTNGADANDPNGGDVPNVAPNGAITWTYIVTNTGETRVPRAQVMVTDNTTGVTPTFDHEKTGNGDTIFDPGEVWIYTATGTALDLTLPPPAGVHTQTGACTHNNTEPPRTAYINLGTVTIPGASANDPSSYCNPPPQTHQPLHFTCYETRTMGISPGTVTVNDEWGTFSPKLSQIHKLCNPTNKNNEDPSAVTNPNHLSGYTASTVGSNPASGHRIMVTDQFGSLVETYAQVHTVMVPAAKSLVGPTTPLTSPGVDHFVCYVMRTTGFHAIKGVTLQDEFGTLVVNLGAPNEFCDPANVNGHEPGAQNDATHYNCYDISLPTNENFKPPANVWIADEFATRKITLDGNLVELCVPATKTNL
jgi:archaellum component FlaG (FlaF/FlaG flagellin family)